MDLLLCYETIYESMKTIKRLISPFYLALLLSLFLTASGSSITLLTTPSLLCEQDTVQFSCTVTSPGFIYESSNAGLNINSSINCVSTQQISAGGVPRLSVMSTGGTTSAPSAQYTISPFLLQDSMTQYRCCADNASNFVLDFTDFISLPLAAPPSSASINISTTYNSANTCTGNIALTWLAVTSDRTVTSYTVLLNGTNISEATPMAMNSYTTRTLNLLEHYATYTVMATSCAGSSISSPVMFIPPIITTVPVTTSTTNSDTLTTTNISSNTQTATVPISTATVPITTSTLPITTVLSTYTTNFDNVTLTVITTSPVNNIPTNSSTLPTSVPPNQAYCYLPCTTSTNSITSTPPIIATTTTNCTPITTGSSITNDATSDALYCNTTPYLVGIIILVLLLLLAILAIVILILFILYLLKNNNSAPKNQQNTNTDDPINTAHIYNYIDLNALAETNEEKHYYSEMATKVVSNTTTTASTTSTTNDDTNDRTGYYNVSTYANLY